MREWVLSNLFGGINTETASQFQILDDGIAAQDANQDHIVTGNWLTL